MLKISLITLAVLALVAAVGIAWARHNGYCARGDYLNHVSARVSRKLDLNDAQNQKLQGLAETLRTLRGDWSEGRVQRSEETKRLLAAPTLDRDQAAGLLTESHEAWVDRRREIVDAFADFSDALQPEQRTRLAEIISDRMQHRWGPARGAH